MSQSQSHSQQQHRQEALGSRENWWGERSLDELRDTKVSELSRRECKQLIQADVDYNAPLDTMSERELRQFVRDLRSDSKQVMPCLSAYEIAEWKAHQILREVSDAVSATARHATPCRFRPGFEESFAWFLHERGDDVPGWDDHDPWAMHRERCDSQLTDAEIHVPRECERGVRTEAFGQHRFRRRYDPEHGYIGGVAFDEMRMSRFLEVVEIVLNNAQVEHSFTDEKRERWFEAAKAMKSDQDNSDQDVLTEVLRRVYNKEVGQ